MANRRIGGMGGPHRGNRSFSQHQPFQGSNVSPWQGNAPSNNSMSQGLISQITSNPQQLALALTSLLQPQQQMNNPPSLLSLNTSPAFSNQDRDFNRFGNRGRDFRRHEPYNKNRSGGWRQLDNNRRNRNNRDGGKRSPGKDNKLKSEKPQQKKDQKKSDKVDDTIDLSVDEGKDEDGVEETKRDWKAEKNNEKSNVDADDNQDDGDNKDGDSDKKKEGKYYDVPVKYLHCFVCNKEMWDGESMQKHVRGRAHKQMLNSLEESIHITVNILRENMRLAEEKKVIELNRMHRLKKYNRYQETESHCNMCDLKFLGKIIAHRKTEGHQRLKRYLHPNCLICSKEFPSRMEWVEHRLTPEHLRKLNELLEKQVGGSGGEEIIEEEEDLDLEPLLDESLQMESENPIFELTDDLAGLQNLLPAYKRDRAVSTKSLKPFSGFMCELCFRSFADEDLAQKHLKSQKHYYAFIEAAKEKYQKNAEEQAKKKADEGKGKEEESQGDTQNGEDLYDPEEACNEEEGMEVNEEEEEEVEKEEAADAKKEEEENGEELEAEPEVKEEEVKEEPVTAPASPPRATRRAAAATPAKATPGPKSKKLAVATPTKQAEQAQPRPKAADSSSFRIPKLEGAVKGGACPKSKKPQTQK